jgi:recombination protein RecR
MANAIPEALQRLINNFSALPGVGEKTATRYALYTLRSNENFALEFSKSLKELHEKIKLCSVCMTYSQDDPCPICSNIQRDSSVLCVVEDPSDLLAIEDANTFKGLYHVLHGAISLMDKITPENLKLNELERRLDSGSVKEVIIATSSTRAGETTAHYIFDILKDKGVKITRIGYGIPMGMDIKYADRATLSKSLGARQEFQL